MTAPDGPTWVWAIEAAFTWVVQMALRIESLTSVYGCSAFTLK
jgi:hypothetical protein